MKKNRQTITALYKSLVRGATITKACQEAGIARHTFYIWTYNDPKFKQIMERAKRSRIQMVEDALFVSAMKGSVNAQIHILKHKGGWREDPLVDMSQHTYIHYEWKSSKEKYAEQLEKRKVALNESSS